MRHRGPYSHGQKQLKKNFDLHNPVNNVKLLNQSRTNIVRQSFLTCLNDRAFRFPSGDRTLRPRRCASCWRGQSRERFCWVILWEFHLCSTQLRSHRPNGERTRDPKCLYEEKFVWIIQSIKTHFKMIQDKSDRNETLPISSWDPNSRYLRVSVPSVLVIAKTETTSAQNRWFSGTVIFSYTAWK